MRLPKVSVIIPAFNQGLYIGEAVQSVLNQTHADWELIVVNDGSTDSTADVIAQFDDPRIHYIFQTNQGVSKARNVGIESSSGEYLAFLDADDMLDPHNLELQAAHLDQNQEIGLTYVSRIEIDQDGNRLRFHRAPPETTLKELILGFPFSPSDFMIRRFWIEKAGVFNTAYTINEDRDFFLRLMLAGCRFAGVKRFLACRRFYTDRTIPNLPAKLKERLAVLDSVFTDPRCTAEIAALRNMAHRNIFMEWAYQAAVKSETDLAQEYFQEILQYDRSVLKNPDELFQRLVDAATRDGGEHETRLQMVFGQLPVELSERIDYRNWALAYGYLHRGIRDLMWGRKEKGDANLNKAITLGLQLDKRSLRMLRYQLLNYDAGFGPEKVHVILRKLSPYLKKIGGQKSARQLQGWYSFTRASQDYKQGDFASAFKQVARALFNDPGYLTNRQLLAILFHSVRGMLNTGPGVLKERNEPMRIAFIVNGFPILSETFILNQITGLLDRGHQVKIFPRSRRYEPKVHADVVKYKLLEKTYPLSMDTYTPGDRLAVLRVLGAASYLILKNMHKRPRFFVQRLQQNLKFHDFGKFLTELYPVAVLLDHGPYDVIHSHFGSNGKLAVHLKGMRAFDAKIITTFHAHDITKHIVEQGNDLYANLFKSGDLFMSISQLFKDRLIGLGCDETKVMIHRAGVDTDRFGYSVRSGKAGQKVRLITIARLVKMKGIEYGIRAVAKLLTKYENLEYRIAGDGPVRDSLQSLIQSLKVDHKITLLGWQNQEDVIELLRNSDILLAPSVAGENGNQEGIPVALMEALAQGIPVVSTYHSGIPELIRDGESGFLVPERDADALAEKLEYLITNPETWSEMGKKGRKFVEEHYNINKLNDRLVEIYRQFKAGTR